MPHPDLALELLAFLQRREPRSLFPLGSIRIADLPEHLRSYDLVNYCLHHSWVESSWMPKDAPNYSPEAAGLRLSISEKGAAELAEWRLTDRTGSTGEAAAPARSPTPPPGPTRWATRSMTSTDARYLAFELWKLLRTGERFSDLRRRYDTVRSLRDGGGESSSQYARRHRWVMRLGGTLNRARVVLGGRIRRCRQKVNGLAAGPHAAEPWRTDARRRLAPALTDLTDAIQPTMEVHPESGVGPTHTEILGALDRHETDIRECGQFVFDVAADGREAAIENALNRYPTLLDALIYLRRRNDIRPTTDTEREGGNEHRSHVAGEPISFALTWVHGRCTWQSLRNGAELWDYVGQSARGGIVGAEVREAVVPELRAVDTAEMRRAFWSELLFRFPHVAPDLLASDPDPTVDDLLAYVTRRDPDIDERGTRMWGRPAQSIRPKPQQVAEQPAGPYAGDDLLRYLADRPEQMVAVFELPDRFHDPNVLTVSDADGLIEFGERKHCWVGPVGNPELRVEKGWGFGSITGPNRKPMKEFIAEALSFIGDERIRPHVRLTDQGRVRAARVTVDRRAGQVQQKPKTTATDWRVVQRLLLEMCDNREAYTNLRDLMERTGCRSTSTVSKAIKRSTTLNAWQARYTKGKASPRASSLTKVHLDNTAQTREVDPAEAALRDDPEEVLAHLIQDAEPKIRAKLNAITPEDVQGMTGDQVRQMAEMIANDPDDYNRVLGRNA